MNNGTSKRLMEEARRIIAGGANSTMRVLPYHLPTVIEKADGARLWDVDGNVYIDMNMGYGPLLLGHKNRIVLEAIQEEMNLRGTLLGFPDTVSCKAARLVKKSFPAIDKIRFSSAATEAVQTAVRLACEFTGRSSIILFEGHYHGTADATYHRYHAALGDLSATAGRAAIPGTGGMRGAPHHARVLPWNDAEVLQSVLDSPAKDIAAIIMEPVMGNAGVIPPCPGYLQEAKKLARYHGALLIFDETITGFRIARGGAQERYNVASDITILSKAMGGGVPVSAIGARGDIMELIESGGVFHGGTYSGNQISMAATLAVQEYIDRNHDAVYRDLEARSEKLAAGVRDIFTSRGMNVIVQNVGAMMSLCFVDKHAPRIIGYRDVLQHGDPGLYIKFQHALQKKGVYIHPNRFEPWYVSTAHSDEIIEEVLDRVNTAVDTLVDP